MKNIKTVQEFPFTTQPVTILSGAHQGKTEIHLKEQFTPAKMEGLTRVAPACVETKSHAEMALILFQTNTSLTETDTLNGPCIVRTVDGLQAGRLDGHHGTPESLCVVIADLKRLVGRSLVMARLAAAKTKLSEKYGRLAAKCGSKGRKLVLTGKALRYRTAARSQWQKAFRTMALPTITPSEKISAN